MLNSKPNDPELTPSYTHSPVVKHCISWGTKVRGDEEDQVRPPFMVTNAMALPWPPSPPGEYAPTVQLDALRHESAGPCSKV